MLNLFSIICLCLPLLIVAVSKQHRDVVIKTPLLPLITYVGNIALVVYYQPTWAEHSVWALVYIVMLAFMTYVVLPSLKKCC